MSGHSEPLTERLVTLESYVAQQERLLQDLSDVLAEQFRVLDQTRHELARLSMRVEAMEGRVARQPPPDAPPPHD